MFSKSVNTEKPEKSFCGNDDYASNLKNFGLKSSGQKPYKNQISRCG